MDPDEFWSNDLVRANEDLLFSCFLVNPDKNDGEIIKGINIIRVVIHLLKFMPLRRSCE